MLMIYSISVYRLATNLSAIDVDYLAADLARNRRKSVTESIIESEDWFYHTWVYKHFILFYYANHFRFIILSHL